MVLLHINIKRKRINHSNNNHLNMMPGINNIWFVLLTTKVLHNKQIHHKRQLGHISHSSCSLHNLKCFHFLLRLEILYSPKLLNVTRQLLLTQHQASILNTHKMLTNNNSYILILLQYLWINCISKVYSAEYLINQMYINPFQIRVHLLNIFHTSNNLINKFIHKKSINNNNNNNINTIKAQCTTSTQKRLFLVKIKVQWYLALTTDHIPITYRIFQNKLILKFIRSMPSKIPTRYRINFSLEIFLVETTIKELIKYLKQFILQCRVQKQWNI